MNRFGFDHSFVGFDIFLRQLGEMWNIELVHIIGIQVVTVQDRHSSIFKKIQKDHHIINGLLSLDTIQIIHLFIAEQVQKLLLQPSLSHQILWL